MEAMLVVKKSPTLIDALYDLFLFLKNIPKIDFNKILNESIYLLLKKAKSLLGLLADILGMLINGIGCLLISLLVIGIPVLIIMGAFHFMPFWIALIVIIIFFCSGSNTE